MAVERQDLVTIGSNIAKYRKLKNYTQKELGDILDVNYKTISKWENGNVAPDITLLKSLADVLDISLDELLSGIKVKHKKNKFLILLNTILCLFIVFLTGVLIYFNNTKYDLYEFKSNHDLFNIEGYIVNGKDESRFVIEDVSYLNKSRIVNKANSLTIEFFYNEQLIYSDDVVVENEISIEDLLSHIDTNITFIFDDIDRTIDVSKISVKLFMESEKGEKQHHVVYFDDFISKSEN